MIVVIPWRDNGDPHRRAHFWRLQAWYSQGWPVGFPVVVGNNEGEFNRAAARNAGVVAADPQDGIVAVVDADNLIAHPQLAEAAIKAHTNPDRVVKPFTHFGYLSRESTEAWYRGDLPLLPSTPGSKAPVTWEGDGPQVGFTGGAYVMRKQVWQRLGGMDEGFTGWGGEDDAFTLHAQRELGPILAVRGTAYHLWHPTPGRQTSPENYKRLMEKYVR